MRTTSASLVSPMRTTGAGQMVIWGTKGEHCELRGAQKIPGALKMSPRCAWNTQNFSQAPLEP